MMLLTTQYRMHPAIMAFPSQQFYQGRVISGIAESKRPLIAGLPWPDYMRSQAPALPSANGASVSAAAAADAADDTAVAVAEDIELTMAPADVGGYSHVPVVFLECEGRGEVLGHRRQSGDLAPSYRNHEEAQLAVTAAYAMARGGDVRTVALLTPYQGQVRVAAARKLSSWLPCAAHVADDMLCTSLPSCW